MSVDAGSSCGFTLRGALERISPVGTSDSESKNMLSGATSPAGSAGTSDTVVEFSMFTSTSGSTRTSAEGGSESSAATGTVSGTAPAPAIAGVVSSAAGAGDTGACVLV